jgi:hypothetical protein
MENTSRIKCPNCAFEFSVESVLATEIEERLRIEIEQKFVDRAKSLSERETSLDNLVQEKMLSEREKISTLLRQELQAGFETRLKSLDEENREMRQKNQDLREMGIENERLKRSIAEREQELRLAFEKQMTDQLREETEKIIAREAKESELKLREKDVLIQQLNEKMNDAQQKIQQGSMQLQGEVQELALEELIGRLYPQDSISEVKKGQRGADVLHEVRIDSQIVCGKIYYESKRTKSFGGDWVSKLKDDNRSILADVCVIVTQALPAEIAKVGQIDGVWICTFQDIEWLSNILRQTIIQVYNVASSQTNKGEKTQMLYDYMTSKEFQSQFEAIVEGFKGLQDSYHDEKLKMQKIWKEREKQLEKVLLNAASFYGSIRGIARDAIPAVKMLEGASADLLDAGQAED